jgi:hypothetical protein
MVPLVHQHRPERTLIRRCREGCGGAWRLRAVDAGGDRPGVAAFAGAGQAAKPTARELGLCTGTVRAHLLRCGGIRPEPRRRAPGRLSPAEREEISCGLAAGQSIRAIAVALGRSPSTSCREVCRNGDARRYRAARADQAAWARAARPKACKLASNPALRANVEEKLARRWSPEQIAGWLKLTYPKSPEMQVSHESICRTLYVQSRGALRKELTRYLRTGRVIRRPKGVRLPDGGGGRPNTRHEGVRPGTGRPGRRCRDRSPGRPRRVGPRWRATHTRPRTHAGGRRSTRCRRRWPGFAPWATPTASTTPSPSWPISDHPAMS